MPLKAYLDAFNTGTAAIGTDKTTPESGTYPDAAKALIAWASGRTETTDTFAGADTFPTIGVAASPTNRAVIAGESDDGNGTSQTDRTQREDALLASLAVGASATIDGLFDLVSFNADTVTWEPDDVMPRSLRALALLLFGSDVEADEVLRWQDRLGAGALTVNGFATDIDFVIDIYIGLATDPPTATSAKTISIAVCNLNTLDQWVYTGRTQDGQTTPNSGSYFRGGEFVACPTTDPTAAFIVIAAIDAKVSNGFTLNYSTADSPASGREHFTLGVKLKHGGAQVKVGTGDTLTDTTTDIDVACTFLPRGGLVVSAGKAQNASGTPHVDDRMSLGGWSWDGTTLRQGCHFVGNDDGIDPSRDFSGVSHDQVYLNGTNDAMTAEMRVRLVDEGASPTVHFRMTDAEASGTKFGYLIVGEILELSPSSIGSGEAFGTATIIQTIEPGGIASAEAIGSHTVSLAAGDQTISGAGAIASAEAHGTATVTPGAVTVAPSSIGSAEAHGSPTLHQTVDPSGIASAEAFGTATILPGEVSVAPSSIGSGEAHGTAVIVQVIESSGIGTGEAHGTPTITQHVEPGGIASAEALGTPTLTVGEVSILPSSIGSAEAHGTPTVTLGESLVQNVGAIASEEAFGTPTIVPGAVTVSPSAIASQEAHGTPFLNAGEVTVSPSGIGSGEAHGSPTILPGQVTLLPLGIASLEALGSPTLLGGDQIISDAGGIGSGEAFGNPEILGGNRSKMRVRRRMGIGPR